jgi:hypothetical protein
LCRLQIGRDNIVQFRILSKDQCFFGIHGSLTFVAQKLT